ncbi:MAG: Nudix family hydrolase [Methylobacter tundripaludum]|uniref:8-oxo-dGTP diphosphatase n=1 Tax=Methylobacter tundripaludum TaxID=173365 RepID=A0A2S6H2E0_9GAMM|nr:Nudix family hydrolase [Methylobacter tundripaludum]MCK9638163.1 Nudix family hydrolase [Methylobacter tundripaludum]PPK71655.1 8-oxo-dGTPase [Methylobacter tundripaludum]
MNPLQVAVGVVKNPEGKILISLRHADLHQGGLWEFPGGKIEEFETAEQALARELKEEINITVTTAIPLITIKHQYPDRLVQLNVFLVEQFSGEAKSLEGQLFKWVTPAELEHYAFPAANRPIITAARLPHHYAILDDADEALLLTNLQEILNRGVKLIQARLKTLPPVSVTKFIEQAYPLCQQQQAVLLMNSAVECPAEVDGVHLTSNHLMALRSSSGQALTKRPKWLAASCHNLEQLLHAQNIGVDFVVLAPVLATQTHPGAASLGWEQFADLVAKINLPVYALGGMTESNLTTARQSGGQGIAAIRAFLD